MWMQINMILLEVLLSAGLLFNVVTAVNVTVEKTKVCSLLPLTHLPYGIITPRHYNLLLTARNNSFVSEIRIKIDIHRETSIISLHAHNLNIIERNTVLDNNDNDTVHKPQVHIYCEKTQMLIMYFNGTLLPGSYLLYMMCTGTINNSSGLVKHEYVDAKKETKWMLTTPLGLVTTRRLFPCWDEPPMKASFRITVKHPSSHFCLSNTPMLKVTKTENYTTETTFVPIDKMPTHLLGIAIIINFTQVHSDRFSNYSNSFINLWSQRETLDADFEFAYLVALNVAFSMNKLKWSEKLPKIDLILIPGSEITSKGSYGLIFYGEEHIAYHQQPNSLHRRINTALIVAYEVVRQWFGGILSPAEWTDLWLIEGLAKFFQYYSLEEFLKNYVQTMDLFVVEVQQPALRDKFYAAAPVNYTVNKPDPNYTFCTPPMCYKAAAIIRTLYYSLTKSIFINGVIKYFDMNANGSVTSNDFYSAVNNAVFNESNSQGDNVIRDTVAPWTTKRHCPVMITQRQLDMVRLVRRKFDYSCSKNYSGDNVGAWIPITYTTQKNPDYSTMKRSITWLRPNQAYNTYRVNPSHWFLLNLRYIGNYRVNYDVSSWQQIAHGLNSERYTDIHVLNRAQIIDDAFHFVMEGQLDASVFWDIVKYLTRERNYIPWYTMGNVLSRMSNFFKYADSANVKIRIIYILDEIINNIGYNKSNDHSEEDYHLKSIRQLTIKWACSFCHVKCQETAASDTEDDDVPSSIVFPWWEDWSYCTGLTMSSTNASSWIDLNIYYERTLNPKILDYMTYSEHLSIIKLYFTKLLSNEFILDDTRRFALIHTLVKKHVKQDSVLTFVLSHLHRLPSEQLEIEVLNDILSNIHFEKQLDEVRSFVQTKATLDKTSLNIVKKYIQTNEARLVATKKEVATFVNRFKIQGVS